MLILYTFSNGNFNNLLNIYINGFNIKIKVYGQKNLLNLTKEKCILMCNHINPIDFAVIKHVVNNYTKQQKNIYTIVKHNLFGDKTDKNMLSNMLGYMKKDLYNKLQFIPYERGNKNSGNIIKKKILKIIDKKNTILLFPDGETRKDGIPQDFKPGSFKICASNKIKILPITLKYKENIGINRKDPVNINNWFNVNANIYIHPLIYDDDWDVLRTKVFNTISKPFFNQN
jgi:1-acyl-sn-glycerol-3-phosphate acyltransferase